MSVIFFDLDGTLIDSTKAFPRVFAQVARDFGVDADPERIRRAMNSAWPWYEANLSRYHEKGVMDFWLGFNRQVCLELGAGKDSQAMAKKITETFRKLNLRKLFPDSINCLETLQQRGFRLGIITARPDAREVIEPFGLGRYFSYIVDACSAGSAKLDAKIYHYARRLAKLKAGEAIHVGDEIERDVLPAQEAGLLPILVDRENHHARSDHLRITELSELPDFVCRLIGSPSPTRPTP